MWQAIDKMELKVRHTGFTSWNCSVVVLKEPEISMTGGKPYKARLGLTSLLNMQLSGFIGRESSQIMMGPPLLSHDGTIPSRIYFSCTLETMTTNQICFFVFKLSFIFQRPMFVGPLLRPNGHLCGIGGDFTSTDFFSSLKAAISISKFVHLWILWSKYLSRQVYLKVLLP